MLRLRAILALLLTVSWCSAAWHVNLEAVGLILEHQHHHHDDHKADHGADHDPCVAHDDHEQVFASDLVKNQTRAGASAFAYFLPPAFADWLGAARPHVTAIRLLRPPTEADPPSAHVWQFVQRCAPESAAPPSLG